MSAPDFGEAVLGFRAWAVDREGGLIPWTLSAAGAWAAGVNRAACHRRALRDGVGPPGAHASPDPRCMCGLYALSSAHDERLAPDAWRGSVNWVVGAIGAWGDMEVHATGIRAEYACVLALAEMPDASEELRERWDRAAERYGVDLVPWPLLELTGRRFAAPLPASAVPGLRRRRRPDAAGRFAGLGVAVEDHVWARVDGEELELGITRALAGVLPARLDLALTPPDTYLRRGDELARIAAGGERWLVRTPFSGTVAAAGAALQDDPDALRRAPTGAGWIARLRPARWAAEAPDLRWGPGAVASYLSEVAGADDPDDPRFLGLRPRQVAVAPPFDSWDGVRRRLRERRASARFAGADEVDRVLAGALRRRLADPAVAWRVGRLDGVVRFELCDPALVLSLEARASGVRLLRGEAGVPPALTLRAPAGVLADWLGGTEDMSAALARGEVASSGTREDTLAAASLLSALRGDAGLRAAARERRVSRLTARR